MAFGSASSVARQGVGINGVASHDWTDRAQRSGYYDQAHMIHEFQEFTGVTPSYHAAHRTEYPNYLYLD